MILELAKASALLLALCALHQWIIEFCQRPRNAWCRDLLSGVLFGGIAIIGMLAPIVFFPGVIFDPRSVILAMAGVFAGPVGAVVSAAMAVVCRVWIGGVGLFAGLGLIVTSALLGVGFRWLTRHRSVQTGFWQFLALGFVVHVVGVLLILTLPADLVDQALDDVVPAFLLVFAPATAILGVMLHDIETKIQTRGALRENQDHLQYLFDNLPVSIWEADLSGVYRRLDGLRRSGVLDLQPYLSARPREADALLAGIRARDANPATLALFGAATKPQVLNALVTRLFRTDDPVFVNMIHAIWTEARSYQTEVQFPSLDGVPVTAVLSMSLPRTVEGRSQVPVNLVDITERRRMEDALYAAKAEAERANRAKSDFLAAMSHDLRTPLNAIIGFSELMQMQPFGALGDARYGGYLDDIRTSGLQLVSMINDILDLSRVEAGRYELHEEEVDVLEVVNASVSQLTTMAADRRQQIDVRKPDQPVLVRADPRLLQQIVSNLLNNAIKFSGEETVIDVTVARLETEVTDVTICDRGIGMTRAEIAAAMQPFGQTNRSAAVSQHGTGLGLFLCQRFARLHGGDMAITSAPGQGTSVTVSLPASRAVS